MEYAEICGIEVQDYMFYDIIEKIRIAYRIHLKQCTHPDCDCYIAGFADYKQDIDQIRKYTIQTNPDYVLSDDDIIHEFLQYVEFLSTYDEKCRSEEYEMMMDIIGEEFGDAIGWYFFSGEFEEYIEFELEAYEERMEQKYMEQN